MTAVSERRSAISEPRSSRLSVSVPRFGAKGWFVIVVLVSAALVLPPLVLMVWTSLTPDGTLAHPSAVSLQAYRELFTSASFKKIATDTVVFTVGSSLLALALGTVMAWFVARTNMAGKGLVYACVFLSFAIP